MCATHLVLDVTELAAAANVLFVDCLLGRVLLERKEKYRRRGKYNQEWVELSCQK